MLQVLILAGGLGTRLGELTSKTPKAMIKVAEKPFIYHQLKLLESYGIKKVTLALGRYGKEVEKYVKGLDNINIDITVSYDGNKLLGTGGAVKKALPLLNNPFFVLYGDSYLDVNYYEIASYFSALNNKKGLMTVLRNMNRWDKSNILFENNNILKYDKNNTTPQMQHIDFGLGVLRHSAFDEFNKSEKFDLVDVYKSLLKKNELAAFEVKNRFYEIGSLEGIKETSNYILKKSGNNSK